ncbi:MAG: phage tail sheath protein, partial [Lawsonibacter sp.]|nr:phage tail sheath protein [Lawsonibacter sp.]
AAAVAGAIAGESDPAVPLGGAELLGLNGLSARLEDNDVDRLILGGVTPVESLGGIISVVRGVTTRTASGGTPDSSWRDLSAIRVVDDVIPGLRSALRARFRRAKNTPQSRGAIRAQVVLELENKLAREIITGYEDVSVSADPQDPTRCLVEFSFTVAHGLNQIWLTAHITV